MSKQASAALGAGEPILPASVGMGDKTMEDIMQRGPLKALLATLAVAGYQNRDKIAEILKGMAERPRAASGSEAHTSGEAATEGSASTRPTGGLDDIMDKLRGGLAAGGLGSILNGGLNDLLDQFRQSGHQKKADSWVNTGANEPIDDNELHAALGPDMVREVAAKTGLTEEEVLRRLSRNLPDAVDGLTPDGTVPQA
jgi:uncharacterized protein YidB (DUF937 family)